MVGADLYRTRVFTAYRKTQARARPSTDPGCPALCFPNFEHTELGEGLPAPLSPQRFPRGLGDSAGFQTFKGYSLYSLQDTRELIVYYGRPIEFYCLIQVLKFKIAPMALLPRGGGSLGI